METNSGACPFVGSRAPDFSLASIDGLISLSEFVGRQNIVIYGLGSFIASRCWQGALALGRLSSWLQRHETTVLLIGGDFYLGPATRLASELNLPFRILADLEDRVLCCFGLEGCGLLPNRTLTVLIDKQGVVRYLHRGSLAGVIFDENGLKQAIADLPLSVGSASVQSFNRPIFSPSICAC